MQPIPPKEVAARVAAERKPMRDKRNQVNVARRRDAEFERDLRAMGFDVRGGADCRDVGIMLFTGQTT